MNTPATCSFNSNMCGVYLQPADQHLLCCWCLENNQPHSQFSVYILYMLVIIYLSEWVFKLRARGPALLQVCRGRFSSCDQWCYSMSI